MPAITSSDFHPRELPPHISGVSGQVPAGLVISPNPPRSRCRVTPTNLPVGTVLGRIAETGLVTLCDKTATDGRQIPIGILAAPGDMATGSGAIFYEGGDFNPHFAVWHASWSLPDLAGAIRDRGITFRHRTVY